MEAPADLTEPVDAVPVDGPGPRPSGPSLRIGARRYPVVPPNRRDPRLRTASVLLTVQFFGQVSLGFELSIAQILASILTCAVIEVAVTFRRSRIVAWPASAMLTGNGVALLLRVNGTVHGDWWSTNGIWYFVGVSALAMATKYAIRLGDRHLFNPSNIALVTAFLVFGRNRINPQDLWWGHPSVGLFLTVAVIVVGGVLITRSLRLLEMGLAFWAVFAAGMAVLALTGHSMRARWSFEPVAGREFWWILVTSPETLIFLFFMITDPRTVPAGRVSRLFFGASVGAIATLFIAPQSTEFATKVGLLAGLTAVTVVWPLVNPALPRLGTEDDGPRRWARAWLGGGRPSAQAWAPWRVVGAIGAVALFVGVVLVANTSSPTPSSTPAIARPDVSGAVADLPEVRVTPAAERVNANLSPELARKIGLDVAADLAIEAQAAAAGDPRLAATAAVGKRLAEDEAAIRRRDDRDELRRTYTFDSLTLDVVHSSPQAVPAFTLEVEGTVYTEVSAGVGAPFHATFLLALVGDHYVIAEQLG